jgi:hypothetical protein
LNNPFEIPRVYNIPINKLHQEASENLGLYATNPDGVYVFNNDTPVIGELLSWMGGPPGQGPTYGVDTTFNPNGFTGGDVYGITLDELEPIVRQALIEYGGDPTLAIDQNVTPRAFRINGLVVYDFVDFENAGDGGTDINFEMDGGPG